MKGEIQEKILVVVMMVVAFLLLLSILRTYLF